MPPTDRSEPNTRSLALLQILAAAAILLWPLLVAGRPTLFADTGAYWRQGRTLVVQGLRLDRQAPDPFDLTLGAQVIDHKVARDPKIAASYSAARSPIYGLFLFVTQRLGTLWLTAAAQTFIAAAVIFVVWRAAAPQAAGWTYLALIGALAATSSLPYYASFAMPDIFAGLDILIIAALTLYWDRLPSARRIALWALLAVSLSFHATHSLVAAAMIPAAAWILWRRRAPSRAILLRLGATGAAIAVAALAGLAASAGVRVLTGAAAHNPPFLTARLLADGPGRTYLRRACAHAQPYLLCRFKDRPLDSSDAILWWNYADKGVFMTSNLADRLALEAEQPRFVVDVIAADPLAVAGAALRDFGEQLGRFYVDDPLHDPCEMTRFWYWSQSTARVLVVDPDRCAMRPGLLAPPALVLAIHAGALLLAGMVIWRAARARRADRGDDSGRLLAAAGLIGAAIIANAAICGILSGPFARYEARLIWLAPLLAGLIACRQTQPAFSRSQRAPIDRPAAA